MNFNIKEATVILECVPQTLEFFLSSLSGECLHCNEEEGT